MKGQRCQVGYPAHGAKIEDLPRKIRQDIGHNEPRKRQIYSVLVGNKAKMVRAGQSGKASLTTRELVYSLYGNVPDDVIEMALEPSTTQVLWKLAEDRKPLRRPSQNLVHGSTPSPQKKRRVFSRVLPMMKMTTAWHQKLPPPPRLNESGRGKHGRPELSAFCVNLFYG